MNMSLREAFVLSKHKYYYQSENSFIIEKDGIYYCRVRTEEDARKVTHYLKKIGFDKENLEKALSKTGVKRCNGGTNTGFYRTSKIKNQNYKLGYVYMYQCTQNGKRIVLKSIELSKLRKKVLDKGLDWYAETDEAKKLEKEMVK